MAKGLAVLKYNIYTRFSVYAFIKSVFWSHGVFDASDVFGLVDPDVLLAFFALLALGLWAA